MGNNQGHMHICSQTFLNFLWTYWDLYGHFTGNYAQFIPQLYTCLLGY